MDMSRLPEEQFPQRDAAPSEANDPNPARWVMDLRGRICYLLSILRIHSPDCEHCYVHEMRWGEMRNRLEELSWRTQPYALQKGDQRELVKVPDSHISQL